MSGSSIAHELPDGFVERGIAIVVREDFARIEYRIGASDATMKMQLAEWKIDSSQLEGEELRQCFADSALVSLPGKMRFFSAGRALEFEPVDARVGGQHHVSAVITFDVQMPVIEGQAKLRFEDHAFGSLDGAYRLAFKSTGGVMTRNSKFAPTLVRADRQVLPNRPESGRQPSLQMGILVLFPAGDQLEPSQDTSFRVKEIHQKLETNWLDDDFPPNETGGQ